MPPKKRGGLCYRRSLQNQRRQRQEQTQEQILSQRQSNAASMAATRANETVEQTSSRRIRIAELTALARFNETPVQTATRRNEESQRASTKRKNEPLMVSNKRLRANNNRNQSRKNERINLTRGTAVQSLIDESLVVEYNCGTLTIECQYCHSMNFKKEQPSDKEFNVCCNKGKVVLPALHPVPDLIKNLMTNKHAQSKEFMDHIRNYNSAFAFASMGANIASPSGYGPYCFRIHGQIYHRTGTLHPTEGEQRKFAQIYILDAEEATEHRMNLQENSSCSETLMRELGNLMNQVNPFAASYKMLHEVEKESNEEAKRMGIRPSLVAMAIRQNRNDDPRRYNAPRVNEVAVVFQNTDGEPPLERDLLIHLRHDPENPNTRQMQRISVLNKNLEPYTYPLLFPYGEQGWSDDIPLLGTGKRTRVTQMQYYGYRFAIRDEFNPLLNAGKLTQQYFVDAYVRTEANRLNYIRNGQKDLRTDLYKGLLDHLNNQANENGVTPGVPVILPSSFAGSPRNMEQNYQDAMAIVRKFGKPDLFITMTCNPKWKEIVENLKPWQKTEFRPDLVARVFNLKLKELLNDLMNKHVLGTPVAKVHVIEFQKRGLPHAHILLILKGEDKPNCQEKIDKIVCAEIPDETLNPRLHEIVLKHMVHGPCGSLNPASPCMVDRNCSKNFPKPFEPETIGNLNGYPRYKRRDTGKEYEVRRKMIDNRWIVPYNPFLSLKYNCHINIEVCASVKSVKYLFKYVYKGHDCANIDISEKDVLEHNEIKTFMDSRYVSAPEAAWRLSGFAMHQQTHTIVRLAVHLPNLQSVYFNAENIETAVRNAALKDSSLTAWFKLNVTDPTARQYLYSQIPEFYRFVKNEWIPRQRGGQNAIGRMYSVSMKDQERYFMRILLLHVPGATSFEDLKTVDGIVSETFQEAASKMGLLKDDSVWTDTLTEAALSSMPRQFRELFALILVLGSPNNVLSLWEQFKDSLIEGFSNHPGHNEDCLVCENFALRDIQEALILHGKRLSDFGLRTPPSNLPRTISEVFDAETEKNLGQELYEKQRDALETIIKSMCNTNRYRSKCFFLDGPGGSGKTYLYKTLSSVIRGKGEIVLMAASTGIAANLLKGGRTYFSLYKLPVPLLETSSSSMRLNSEEAKQIRRAKLLIWDEATMATNHALNAVNRLLMEVMNNKTSVGGKVFFKSQTIV